jgi:6-phosphogluconolactonase/glucosamine-6-phosphate isomerase/deaminase
VLKFQTLTDTQSASKVIADRLHAELSQGKQVLWLISGGSNIDIETQALSEIPLDLQTNLTIALNDERYGPYGHKDSNMQQFNDALQSETKANIIPVIVPESLPLQATTMHFGENIDKLFNAADIVVSQLGMGNDGHIAGILPGSPAISAKGSVTSYTAEQYERITITFETLRRIHVVYLFAFGSNKRQQLEQLRDENIPIEDQPAQFLKQLPEVYVYNDQLDTVTTDDKGGY